MTSTDTRTSEDIEREHAAVREWHARLRRLDWFYMMSDGGEAYRDGKREEAQVAQDAEALGGAFFELWRACLKWRAAVIQKKGDRSFPDVEFFLW